MFEQATKLKLRFSTDRGQLSVEDLWDLPLTGKALCLDNIAKSVNKALKETDEESFVTTRSKSNTELTLKLDILKHIISVKKAEKDAAKNAAENKARKEQLKGILARKQDAALENMSEEDLKKELEALG